VVENRVLISVMLNRAVSFGAGSGTRFRLQITTSSIDVLFIVTVVAAGVSAEYCCLCGGSANSSAALTVCASCGLGK